LRNPSMRAASILTGRGSMTGIVAVL